QTGQGVKAVQIANTGKQQHHHLATSHSFGSLRKHGVIIQPFAISRLQLHDRPTSTYVHSTAIMITDSELYSLAIFLGSAAMVLIIIYHFFEVNANDKTPVNEKVPANKSR
ncbi:Oligosaccaryltransferase-domain-containing protein, partial [Apiosordaria backusii]